jgi:ribosome maturation factor RimP
MDGDGIDTTRDDASVVARVRRLVAPIASDLGLDVYDVEQRGGTLRVTLDTPPGSPAGIDLDTLALATRLVSRELDHEDPVPGRYTLEVTSPGVERALRTPAHFRREIGKTVNVRLSDVGHDERRLEGELVGADDTAATLRVVDPATGEPADRVIPYGQIDRAKTVFVWGPRPKPGGPKSRGATKGSAKGASRKRRDSRADVRVDEKEKQSS